MKRWTVELILDVEAPGYEQAERITTDAVRRLELAYGIKAAVISDIRDDDENPTTREK